MAEIIEGEVVSEGQVPAAPEAVGGDGVTKGLKKPIVQPTANDNRIKLYNEILNLKEQGFSDVYKKIGYKKFDSLLQNDSEFQSALLTDLNERGFDISPEDFAFAYTKQKPAMVADFDEVPVSKEEPLPQKDEDGLLSQVKGMFKSVYNATKEPLEDLYKFAKRGFYTGLAGRGAQAENFATGTVDTKNLAQYLKKANDVGATRIEAEFAKDEGLLKDTDDLLAMLIPSVVESFANMAGAGYKKLLGITAAGAGTGAMVGGLPGAAVGGGRALQGAMLQQGYNLEFVGTVIDELATKKAINLDADENTLEKQLNAAFANKELMGPIFQKANTRAAAITATDFVLSGMGATVARNLAKSKAAGRVMNTKVGQMFSDLAEKTVANPVYRKAARLTNRVAEIDKKIAGSKLGKAGATVGIQDMFGGAAGETLAQALTQEELDWKSIAVEAGAEGKFINTLRALGKIGEKKIAQKAISQFATEKNLPPNQKPPAPEDEFVAVTEEELSNYKKGNVSPERAAGLADDVDIAFKDPTHLEKVKAADKLYGEMLQDAFNKHMAALENQKLRDVALTSTGETYGKTAEEIAAIIDPNNPAYNEKIANEFKNAYEVLKQQYKEQTGDDSEDTTGVSGKVGGGAESQQTESEQRASEEETGNGGVVQAAADEVRLSDIDEMLADDDNFFKDTGDRLLSPEERQDLEQERARLTGGAATPSTGASTAATPAAAPAAVVTQPPTTTVTAPAITTTTPVVEDVEAVPVEEETVTGGTATTTTTTTPTTKRGKKAAATTTTVAETKTEEKPTVKQIKASDVEIRKGKTHATDGVYEAVYNKKVIGKISFDKKEKMWVDASGDKFAQKKDAVAKMVLQYNMKAEAAAETTTAKGEKKTTTKKAQAKTQAEEEIPVVETEVVEEEVAPEGETKEGLGVIPTLVKGDFERNGDLTDKGFEKATRILKSIIDRVAVKAGVPTKRIYEIFHMTSDGKKYISATKGIMEIQVSDFKDIIKSVKRIAFDMFPNQEEELNQQINKHTDELLDALAEDKPFEVNPSIEKIRKVISDVNSLWAGTVAKAESLLEKGKTETKSETKPTGKAEAKPQITKADVSVRKGPNFTSEGVYEVVHNDKVIGRMYYDRSMVNAWMDADYTETSPSDPKGILGSKKEAIDVFVNRYNANANAKPAATTETKTETKSEAKPTGKTETNSESKKEGKGKWIGKSKEQYVSDRASEILAASENYQKTISSKNKADQKTAAYLRDEANKKAEQEYDKLFNEALLNKTLPNEYKPNYLLTSSEKVAKDKKRYTESGYPQNHDEKLSKQEHKEEVQSAVDNGLYVKAIEQGILTYEEASKIILSAGVKVDETVTATKKEKPTPTAAPAKVPSFSEFDAISADRSKMKEAKAEFIAKHGQLAYDAMKEISANFTKITKALQEKEILTKKC